MAKAGGNSIMIHIKYKVWFSLKVEIEGSGNDPLALCRLEPSDQTRQLLNRQRIIVKPQPGMITHLIEVHADGPDEDKPIFSPQPNAACRYYLKSEGNSLTNATNLAGLDLIPHILYLSNHANNKVGSNRYLHRQGAVTGVQDKVFRAMYPDASPGVLAVIDIYQNDLISADYRLRDGTGKCREPVFTLRLAKPA